MKRYNLQMILEEALKTAKECLDGEHDLGFIEHSLKKIERAGNEIVQQGYSGIAVNAIDFIAHDGSDQHVYNAREAVNKAQRELCERKKGFQR